LDERSIKRLFSTDAQRICNVLARVWREDSEMKNGAIISAFGIVVFAAMLPSAASAQSAYGYGYSQHDQRHERLEDEHDDNHDELDEVHADAHDQGLSRREHRQLHQELQYEHAQSDYQLARQHQRQDRRAWQRRYYNRGYYNRGNNGYYGY
jgi:uncharacterized protein (UPF0335 family)